MFYKRIKRSLLFVSFGIDYSLYEKRRAKVYGKFACVPLISPKLPSPHATSSSLTSLPLPLPWWGAVYRFVWEQTRFPSIPAFPASREQIDLWSDFAREKTPIDCYRFRLRGSLGWQTTGGSGSQWPPITCQRGRSCHSKHGAEIHAENTLTFVASHLTASWSVI